MTDIYTLSKEEGPNEIGHKMSMVLGTRKFWKSIVASVSYLVHFNTLVLNAADIITKCDSFFNIKCGKSLLQKT